MPIVAPLSLLVLGAFLVGAARLWFAYWINPVTLWVGPWILVTTLFSLGLLPFEPLTGRTAVAIALAMVGYLAGSLAVAFKVEVEGGWNRSATGIDADSTLTVERAFAAAAIIGAIGALLLTVQALQEYGIEGLMAAELRTAKKELQVQTSIPLTAAFHLLLPASILSGWRMGEARRVRPLDVLVPVAVLAYGFVHGGRTIFLFWLLLAGLGLVLNRQRRGEKLSVVRAVLVGAAAAVVFTLLFVLIGVFRGSFAYFAVTRMPSGMPLSPALIVGLNLYAYSTSSLASLNHFITHFDGAHTIWTSVAHPITYQLAKLDLVDVHFFQGVAQAFADTPGGSNVYSVLRAFYMDLGLAGCFGYSFLLGGGTSLAYAQVRRRGSAAALIAFGYLGILSFASPYEYMLYSSMHLFAFVAVGLVFARPSLPLPVGANPVMRTWSGESRGAADRE